MTMNYCEIFHLETDLKLIYFTLNFYEQNKP